MAEPNGIVSVTIFTDLLWLWYLLIRSYRLHEAQSAISDITDIISLHECPTSYEYGVLDISLDLMARNGKRWCCRVPQVAHPYVALVGFLLQAILRRDWVCRRN